MSILGPAKRKLRLSPSSLACWGSRSASNPTSSQIPELPTSTQNSNWLGPKGGCIDTTSFKPLRAPSGWGSSVALYHLGRNSEYAGPRNVRFASSGSVGGDGFVFREEEDKPADVSEIGEVVRELAATGSEAVPTEPLGEVAAAVADCAWPSAALQYLIEAAHVHAGLPWWAAIAAVTVGIRTVTLPVVVYQMKATANLTILRPELERLTNLIKSSNYDPQIVEENRRKLTGLFKKHKTSPYSPLVGVFLQAPVFMCFFFAIKNMAEKVESFKQGGALWFMDLTVPDELYLLPILAGFLFWITVELGAAEGMQGNPVAGKMKNFLRGLAVVTVPLTASFPSALFCYWLTSNVFSMVQANMLKIPRLKSALNIPDTSHLLDPSQPVVTLSQPPKQVKSPAAKLESPVVTLSRPPKQAKGDRSARRKH